MARGGAVDFDLIREAQKLAGNLGGGPVPEVPQPSPGFKFPGGGPSAYKRATDAVSQVANKVRSVPGFGPNVGKLAGFARGTPVSMVAGATLEGAYEGATNPSVSALTPDTRLQRAADIFFGAGRSVRALPSSIMNLLGFGDTSATDRRGANFGIPDAQPIPAAETDKEVASPTPPVEAAGGAAQGDDTTDVNYRITNPDGSVSYTNVRKDVKEAVNRGAGVLPIDETYQSRGTVNTFKGPSLQDKRLAQSLFLRDNDFAGARQVAQNDDDLRLIDIKEQQFLNTDPRKAKQLEKAEQLFYAQQSATKAATIKAASDALKAGPEAAKNNAQAVKTNLMLSLALQSLKADPKSASNVMRMLAGIAPESAKLHFTDPINPNDPVQVTKVAPGGDVAERLPNRNRVAVGSPVTIEGKQYKVEGNNVYSDAKGNKFAIDYSSGKLKKVK